MKLDHIVYFTRDDVKGVVHEQRVTGNQVVTGGPHEN